MNKGRGLVGFWGVSILLAACAWSACSPSPGSPSGSDASLADALVAIDGNPGDTRSDVSVDAVAPVDARPTADAADAVAPMDGADAADAADAAEVSTVTRETTWHVEYDGNPVVGATVTVLSPVSGSTTTNASGDFKVTQPVGSSVVVKVTPPAAATAAGVLPMIRGLVLADRNRIRTLYLAGPAERQAAMAVGHTPDSAKGIVEVDFRNASVGGYGATLSSGGAPLASGYGVVLDAMDNPVSSMTTVTGGGGSTLLLGNIPPSASVGFGLTAPAGRTCTPCDATPLPIQAGVVTWFDFECGTATDCK